MLLWQIYAPGKNKTYIRFHVKCARMHTHTYIVADEAGNLFFSSLCRQVTSQM
jgi:hypothetical protein